MREKDLFKKALSQEFSDENKIFDNIVNSPDSLLERKISMGRFSKKKFIVAIIVAATFLATSVYAATTLLSAREAAEEFGEQGPIEKAFVENEYLLEINETQIDNGTKVTFLGYALADGVNYGEDVTLKTDETYAIFAFQNVDETDMTAQDLGVENFTVYPLIETIEPTRLNMHPLSPSVRQTIVDGILYSAVSITDIQHFADYKVYFAVCDEYDPFQGQYAYDENTGEISINQEYDGLNLLFDLPLEEEYADPEKVEEFFALINGEIEPDLDSLIRFNLYHDNFTRLYLLKHEDLEKLHSTTDLIEDADRITVYNISDGKINETGDRIEFEFDEYPGLEGESVFSIKTDFQVGTRIRMVKSNNRYLFLDIISETQIQIVDCTEAYKKFEKEFYNMLDSERVEELINTLWTEKDENLIEFFSQPQFKLLDTQIQSYDHNEDEGREYFDTRADEDDIFQSRTIYFPDTHKIGETFLVYELGNPLEIYFRTLTVISDTEVEIKSYKINVSDIDDLNF